MVSFWLMSHLQFALLIGRRMRRREAMPVSPPRDETMWRMPYRDTHNGTKDQRGESYGMRAFETMGGDPPSGPSEKCDSTGSGPCRRLP